MFQCCGCNDKPTQLILIPLPNFKTVGSIFYGFLMECFSTRVYGDVHDVNGVVEYEWSARQTWRVNMHSHTFALVDLEM